MFQTAAGVTVPFPEKLSEQYELDGNTITALTVETPDETPGLGQNCSEEDFTKQFIGKTLPVELGKDVDAVSGATITSTVVVDALNGLTK